MTTLVFKRFFCKIAYPLAAWILWRVRPDASASACAIATNGKLLLIQRSYGPGMWDLPGGRIGNKETPEETVRREVEEEVGVTLGTVKLFGEHFFLRDDGIKRGVVHCFYIEVPNENFILKSGEIAAAKWVALDSIPEFHTQSVDTTLRFLDPQRPCPPSISKHITIF
ncbi:MAG: NUDIX domain-containing protein [Candidatus Liptonbacteria bacterium]|nr:NUDIX domain-containing protein [Candidatus Liptonbacteria bacterium]